MSSGEQISRSDAARARLKRRYREEARFKFYGMAAIVFAIASLAVLMASIVFEAVSAFTKYELRVEMMLDPAVIDPDGDRDPDELRASVSLFSDLVRDELRTRFPEAADDLTLRRQLARMVSTLSGDVIADRAARNPALVGQTIKASVPVSDLVDLYLKGLITNQRVDKGEVAASLSRSGETIAIDAQGGFAEAHAAIAGRLRDEADARQAAAELSIAALGRIADRAAALDAGRSTLAGAQLPAIVAAAELEAKDGDATQVALARAAGRALASNDLQAFRDVLRADLQALAQTAASEAAELARKGAEFDAKARAALAKGEPTTETRRIQAETAWLASDRRRVDARLLDAAVANVAALDRDGLVAAVSLVTGRALTPLTALTAAQGNDELVVAVALVNRAEAAAAAAALTEQQSRIDGLAAEVATLSAASSDRAKMLEDSAIPAARSRLTRLRRDLETFEETGVALATGEDSALVRELAVTEAQAQLGLDLGGPLAAAFALGAVDSAGQGAGEALRSLMLAHIDRDLAGLDRDTDRLERKRNRDEDAASVLQARISSSGAMLELDEFSPSVLVEVNGGVVKATRLSPNRIEGAELLPLAGTASAPAGEWRVRELETPEGDRLVTDRQAAWADALKASGDIHKALNFSLFTRADSTYPELAGLAAALAGSFWIMLVTLALSLPIGVMAAIYLEEFAPRNRITDFIEVNINNLAAVPSIVFGLLGAAVFINFFNLPRSAPVVGGLVLSLITLPTIIIATRAALGAVPPSIREGALAVGASLPQTVFHHVLPLAAPGILTGAIIGLARALGETAPLLLIGMVAFVAEPPASMFDSATALPVLVYKWSSAAERAWQPMTSAAIIVLLVFMFAMNALAVYLRRRLERRW